MARIIANEFKADFIEISAVTSGKKDVEKVVERAKQNWNLQTRTVLFVDEIHRFNKAQQDAFLPHVESGLITLIGATTENPSFEVISPLLSRSRVVVVKHLSKDGIKEVLKRAIKEEKAQKRVTENAIDYLAELSGGDARSALGDLELALSLSDKINVKEVREAAGRKVPGYDKKGDAHYDNISAFIKSMRGGDVDASLYYLARMLNAGEDPKFIARRMVIFASEDIGLAGNGALGLALNAFMAVERIGMPESKIILSHVVFALTKAKKSRESYDAYMAAEALANTTMDLPVPIWLRNAPTKLMKDLGFGEGQKWEAGFHLDKNYLPDEIKDVKIS
jgi:putative ATPase